METNRREVLSPIGIGTSALVLAGVMNSVTWGAQPVVAEASARSNAQRQYQSCFDQDYAQEKRAAVLAIDRTNSAASRDRSDTDGKDGMILQQDMPLREPPEIARVQRGFVDHFVGAFINDGLESWSAIDLDRNSVISIRRRIYDVRASRSHPFSDPTFAAERHMGHSFARKFSNDRRTELEVISTVRADPAGLQAFICLANAAWAAPASEKPDISDGFQEARLLDIESKDGKVTHLSKSVSFEGPLGFMFAALAKNLPEPSW